MSENLFVFSLTNKKLELPPIQSWLNPNYPGPGSFLFNKELPDALREKFNDPKKYRDDFPDHVYTFEPLIELKDKLNKAKKSLDKISLSQATMKKYNTVTSCARSHDSLRGEHGILHTEFGAEIVTNAWLKMFESMPFIEDTLKKISKSKAKTFNSLHLAEAPGNFLLAINHYLRTNYPKIEWNWLANSYRDLYDSRYAEPSTRYLVDEYKLIRTYPKRWVFGADGDGDITSVANIRSFVDDTKNHKMDELQFVTSDVKYVPPNMNYDEEEMINIPVHFGQMLCALKTLGKGGSMMLKIFTLFEAPSVSMLYLMACCFDHLMVIKPETSKSANAEVYIFGIGYRKKLSEIQLTRLEDVMTFIRFLNNEHGSPALFKEDDIPEGFLEEVISLGEKLVKRQIPNIERNLDLYNKYFNTPGNKICQEFSNVREKIARDWIKKNQVKILEPNERLGASLSRRR